MTRKLLDFRYANIKILCLRCVDDKEAFRFQVCQCKNTLAEVCRLQGSFWIPGMSNVKILCLRCVDDKEAFRFQVCQYQNTLPEVCR